MKKVTAVLIGAGDRGANAYASYAINNPGTIQFVAVAEKNDEKSKEDFRKEFLELVRRGINTGMTEEELTTLVQKGYEEEQR